MDLPDPQAALKKCPFCGKWIFTDASICKYCGESINPKLIAAKQLGKLGNNLQLIGCLMTVSITIPICICLAIYFLSQH